jgi:hypothetical protein
MGHTLEDLRYFMEVMTNKETEKVDPSMVGLRWRKDVVEELRDKKVVKVGVFRDDGELDRFSKIEGHAYGVVRRCFS